MNDRAAFTIPTRLLEGKIAVIYGGGGAIGGAVAREFAREGARIFLAGRSLPKLARVARLIVDEGGTVEYDEVDALDEFSVERHADQVADAAGAIDISLNAVGMAHFHETPFAKLSFAEFAQPIEAYSRTHFGAARAAARHMVPRRSGVILMCKPGSRFSDAGFMGISIASAAVEALSRALAGELGPKGIRVACLQPDAIGATFLTRLPTLAEVGSFAAMVASERAGAMNGAIANLGGAAFAR